MKNKKTNVANILRLLAIIALAAVIGFAFTACGDGGHTHSWSAWKTNATQHWKECDCGEEYGRANHTGMPNCSVCGFTTTSVNLSLDGVWRHVSNTDPNNYEEVTISGNTGIITHVGNYGAGTLSQSAVDKGYLKVNIQWFRNLTKTGDLTWTGQKFGITWNNSAPNVATGTGWMNFTITMAANGQTFTEGGGAIWTRTTNLSLDGVWRHVSNTDPNNYEEVTISGNTGVLTHVGNYGAGTLSQSAVDKGYLKVGIQWFRNLIKTGDLTWTGQKFGITWNDSAPNVATGTGWMNFTITMAANGQTFTEGGGATWTRQ